MVGGHDRVAVLPRLWPFPISPTWKVVLERRRPGSPHYER